MSTSTVTTDSPLHTSRREVNTATRRPLRPDSCAALADQRSMLRVKSGAATRRCRALMAGVELSSASRQDESHVDLTRCLISLETTDVESHEMTLCEILPDAASHNVLGLVVLPEFDAAQRTLTVETVSTARENNLGPPTDTSCPRSSPRSIASGDGLQRGTTLPPGRSSGLGTNCRRASMRTWCRRTQD